MSNFEDGIAVKNESVQKQREAFIATHRNEWKKKGKQHRYIREKLGISKRKLANYIGLSPSVISKFEEGEPLERSRFVEMAYRAALTLNFCDEFYFRCPVACEVTLPDNYNVPFELIDFLKMFQGFRSRGVMKFKEAKELAEMFSLRLEVSEGLVHFVSEWGHKRYFRFVATIQVRAMLR